MPLLVPMIIGEWLKFLHLWLFIVTWRLRMVPVLEIYCNLWEKVTLYDIFKGSDMGIELAVVKFFVHSVKDQKLNCTNA